MHEEIRRHGIRNPHLTSMAPTCTFSLVFTNNARMASSRPTPERAGARRGCRTTICAPKTSRTTPGGDTGELPAPSVTHFEMHVQDRLNMVQTVQPFIDTAISKIGNLPADYPYEDFEHLDLHAWRA
ncbi:hypothetical protein [Massilia sp. X63]|uniref:hypothetical protein n=1 Tax=Massilia sp. X63 TaxID=3237285 RepID=UPI0034DD72AE